MCRPCPYHDSSSSASGKVPKALDDLVLHLHSVRERVYWLRERLHLPLDGKRLPLLDGQMLLDAARMVLLVGRTVGGWREIWALPRAWCEGLSSIGLA